MNVPVTLYDTALRDGTQGGGINLSLGDKLRIAERLDQFGVDYIEGGWLGSNEKDIALHKRFVLGSRKGLEAFFFSGLLHLILGEPL